MNKKEQVIQLCKDIRKMVQDETEFTNTTQAFDILFQVLMKKKMIVSYVQSKIEFVQQISHRKSY